MSTLTVLLFNLFFCSIPKTAFVVNGIGETVSRINLEENTVENDIVTVGLVPNWIGINNENVYVINSASDDIYIIDMLTSNVLDSIELPDYSNPYAMEFLNDSVAYVTALCANSVYCINLKTCQVLYTIPVGLSPEGICITGTHLFVCVTAFNPDTWTWGDGMVYIIDTYTNSVEDSFPVGTNPQDLAVDGEYEVYVVCTGNYSTSSGMIYRVNSKTHEVLDSLAVGGSPVSISISPDQKVWVGAGGWTDYGYVYRIDAITEYIINGCQNPILVGRGAWDLDCDSQGNCYVCNFMEDAVTLLDTAGSIIRTFDVGDGPQAITVFEPFYGIEDKKEKVSFILYACPNPFIDETNIMLQPSDERISHIEFNLPVSLTIYDLTGRVVFKTSNDERTSTQSPYLGYTWYGKDERGVNLKSGVYILRVISGSSVLTKGLTLLR